MTQESETTSMDIFMGVNASMFSTNFDWEGWENLVKQQSWSSGSILEPLTSSGTTNKIKDTFVKSTPPQESQEQPLKNMPKPLKIISVKESVYYHEVKQVFELNFSLGKKLKASIKQLCSPFICREFFNDYMYYKLCGKGQEIYRFNPKIPNVTHLIFEDGYLLENLRDNWCILNSIEALLDLPKSTLVGRYVEFPNAKNHLQINLWTLWMKVLCQWKYKSVREAYEQVSGNEREIFEHCPDLETHTEHLVAISVMEPVSKWSDDPYTRHQAGYAAFINPMTRTSPYYKEFYEALTKVYQ
jgi:hypothetical protein